MRRLKQVIILMMIFGIAQALCGCGVSDANREKMYKEIIKTGDINLSASVDEYDEIKTVSNSPVPGYKTYYIYSGDNKEKFSFEFEYVGSDEIPYRAIVRTTYCSDTGVNDTAPPEVEITNAYIFRRGKLTKKMKLIDREMRSYYRRYSEIDSRAQGGIKSFSLYNGTVLLYFDKDNADEKIEKCISDYKEGKLKSLNITLGTDIGEYNINELLSVRNEDKRNLEIRAGIDTEGIPEWIEIENVRIDVSKDTE